MVFRLPDDTQRSFICGMTGSGKTMAAVWQLSLRSYDKMPWTIIDFKYDTTIAKIERAIEIRLDKPPPTKPGLYIVHPRPDQHEELQGWLWKVWEKGRHGLLIDEGYMVGGQGKKSPAYDAILTQGRSKRIPCITLTQRPVWLPRFVISEANFYQVFYLNSDSDLEKVAEFVPKKIKEPLPEYYSYWYDVSKRFLTVVKPVPDESVILQTFDDRLKPVRRHI